MHETHLPCNSTWYRTKHKRVQSPILYKRRQVNCLLMTHDADVHVLLQKWVFEERKGLEK